VYADGVVMLGENMNTINKKEALLDARREVVIEGNTDKTKCSDMKVSRYQNAGKKIVSY